MASLIGFDKNRENLEFKGHCKLSVNFLSNYLIVEPVNEAFKMISASFKWKYVMKKNLLFVFADFNSLDFCLAFKNEQICKTVFDGIASGKKNTEGAVEDVSIDISFITPIFEAISVHPLINSDLIEIIAKWQQLLDKDEKEKYSKMMQDYGIHDMIAAAAIPVKQEEQINSAIPQNRKRKFSEMKKQQIPRKIIDISNFTKIIPSSQFQVMFIAKQRIRKMILFTSNELKEFHQYISTSGNDEFRCIACKHSAIIDVGNENQICVKMEDKKHACKPSTKIPESFRKSEILQKSDYKLVKNCSRGSKDVLIIFDAKDRSLCHEYYWLTRDACFYCLGCHTKNNFNSRKRTRANIYNEGMANEYVETLDVIHGCEIRKYEPKRYQQNFEYILKPDFEVQKFLRDGKEGQRLIVFDKNDKTKCYQYYHFDRDNQFRCRECYSKKNFASAKLRKNADDEEYVILSHVKHICELRTYIPNEKIELHQHSDFEYVEKSKDEKPRIFVFVKNDRTKCYIFNKREGIFYYCTGCDSICNRIKHKKKKNPYGKRVTGHLIKNAENAKYSFQLKSSQSHFCEPKKYEPEKYQLPQKTYDFFYFRPKNMPKSVNLAIRSAENNKLCVKFNFQNSTNAFVCLACQKKKNNVRIKPQKDAEKKEYFNHDFKKHICQLIKVSSISPPDFVILKEPGLTFESKPKIKIDDSKIVNKPNFELRPNRAGVLDKRLILIHPSDKTLCFDYHFVASHQNFQCGRCHGRKKVVSAKLHKDEENDETFIVMGKYDHVCVPQKYQPPPKIITLKDQEKTQNIQIFDESKIVKMPDFELGHGRRGIPDKRLIVRHPTDKSLCYDFHFVNNHQNYQCGKCHFNKSYVVAKLHKNDKKEDSFIVMGNNEHVCQPIKYSSISKSGVLKKRSCL